MNEDFYATVKLISGEEIFAKISIIDENDSQILLVNCPVVITQIQTKRMNGYKFEPWLKTSMDDLLAVNMNNVLTITENNNKEIIKMHKHMAHQINKSQMHSNINKDSKVSRRMGYLSSIDNARILLEKIYNQ